MLIRLALEHNLEGHRILCWGLDFPGVFTYGEDDAEALLRFPQALIKYETWVNLHTDTPWFHLDDLDFRVLEVFEDYQTKIENQDYEVNAFFQNDLRPLSQEDIERCLLVFKWQRQELLSGIETLPTDLLKKTSRDEPWSIEHILRHLVRAERWYQSIFNPNLPALQEKGVITQLTASSMNFNNLLPSLEGLDLVITENHEKWSPRKLVRRVLWHQRDHIGQIQEIAARHQEKYNNF